MRHGHRFRVLAAAASVLALSCGRSSRAVGSGATDASHSHAPSDAARRTDGPTASKGRLPLVLVSDVLLPGGATRFDYQDVDPNLGRLVLTHMNEGSVLFLDLKDGSVLRVLENIPVARGVVVASDVGLTFVTSSPSSLVLIDSASMTEKTRVPTGPGPDGVAWDPVDRIVGVSDQGDGALSLISNSGNGSRRQVKLGPETGNVVFDAKRGWFWITVVKGPDQLVAVDPVAAKVVKVIDMPVSCSGAHGLRLHPDAKSAFVTCESSNGVYRVDLAAANVTGPSPTGSGPDVMNVDPALGWLYVASEAGSLTVLDVDAPGLSLVGRDQPGPNAHSVAVDPATHRVFFPLMAGSSGSGTPVLRIMRPSGIQP